MNMYKDILFDYVADIPFGLHGLANNRLTNDGFVCNFIISFPWAFKP